MEPAHRQTFALGARQVDLARLQVRVPDGDPLSLTTLEARMLAYLDAQEGRAVSRRELLSEVWGYAPRVRSEAVKKSVYRLRAKIEDDPGEPAYLLTVPGVGYRLERGRRPAGHTNLGAPLDDLVGRVALVGRVLDRLRETRWLTLTGHAGAGKTRLSRAVGRRAVASGAWSWVWFVDLSDAGTGPRMEQAVRASLGREPGRLGRALLILDNLEQVADAARQVVATWLVDCPELTVLATSRVGLGGRGEHVVVVPPLDGAALFRARAHAAGVDDLDAGEIARLVARVDGLPLAIEMAAARADLLPLPELTARLGEGLLTLADGDRTDMRATLLRSWALLDPREQAALAGLSTFRGGFSADAAEAVAGVSLEALHRLRGKSLVRALDSGRWALFEGLRQLAADHARGDTLERHARTFAALAASRDADPAWLAREEANVRQALAVASDDEVPWLIHALARRALHRGLPVDDAWILDRARAVDPETVADGAVLLLARGLLEHLGDDPAAPGTLQRAWVVATERSAPRDVLVRIVRDGALMAIETLRFAEAEVWLERARSAGLPDPETEAWLRVRQRRHLEAAALFEARLAEPLDPVTRMRTLALAALPLGRSGRPGAAQDAARAALALAEAHGGRFTLQARDALAQACLEGGRVAEARTLWETNAAALAHVGSRERLGHTLAGLAQACALVGDLEEAEQHARVALGHLLASRSGYRDVGWWTLGVVLLLRGSYVDSHAALLQLPMLPAAHIDADWLGVSLALLGRLDEAVAVLQRPSRWDDGGVGVVLADIVARLGGPEAPARESPPGRSVELQLAMRLRASLGPSWDREGPRHR